MPAVWWIVTARTVGVYSGVHVIRRSSAPHCARVTTAGLLGLPVAPPGVTAAAAIRASLLPVPGSIEVSATRWVTGCPSVLARTCTSLLSATQIGSVPVEAARRPSRSVSTGSTRVHGPNSPVASRLRSSMTCGVAPVQVTATSLSGSGLVACRAPPESGVGVGVVRRSSSTCAGVAAADGSRAGSTSSVSPDGGAMPIDGAADAGTPVATSTAASGATSPAPTQRPAARVLRPTIPPIGRPQGERAGPTGDTGPARGS